MRFFIISFLGIFLYGFSIVSPFAPKVSKKYVFNMCNGNNISPQIILKKLPKKTKSLAITIYDPDAPHGWWHWAIFNIPKTNTIPEGVGNKINLFTQLINSYGKRGYGGPCPPLGEEHRYVITVYALNKNVSINKNWPVKKALKTIKPFIISKATLTSTYKRDLFILLPPHQ